MVFWIKVCSPQCPQWKATVNAVSFEPIGIQEYETETPPKHTADEWHGEPECNGIGQAGSQSRFSFLFVPEGLSAVDNGGQRAGEAADEGEDDGGDEGAFGVGREHLGWCVNLHHPDSRHGDDAVCGGVDEGWVVRPPDAVVRVRRREGDIGDVAPVVGVVEARVVSRVHSIKGKYSRFCILIEIKELKI